MCRAGHSSEGVAWIIWRCDISKFNSVEDDGRTLGEELRVVTDCACVSCVEEVPTRGRWHSCLPLGSQGVARRETTSISERKRWKESGRTENEPPPLPQTIQRNQRNGCEPFVPLHHVDDTDCHLECWKIDGVRLAITIIASTVLSTSETSTHTEMASLFSTS